MSDQRRSSSAQKSFECCLRLFSILSLSVELRPQLFALNVRQLRASVVLERPGVGRRRKVTRGKVNASVVPSFPSARSQAVVAAALKELKGDPLDDPSAFSEGALQDLVLINAGLRRAAAFAANPGSVDPAVFSSAIASPPPDPIWALKAGFAEQEQVLVPTAEPRRTGPPDLTEGPRGGTKSAFEQGREIACLGAAPSLARLSFLPNVIVRGAALVALSICGIDVADLEPDINLQV